MQSSLCAGSAGVGVGRAAAPTAQRSMLFKRPIFVGTAKELGLKPASAIARKSKQSRAQTIRVEASGSAAPLPWQAAMSEIKKRRDINTIMILGAGPIVIGQVPSDVAVGPSRAFN